MPDDESSEYTLTEAVDESTVKFKQKQILRDDGNDNLTIYGFRKNSVKSFMTYLFYVISLGIVRLIFHWFPTWRLYMTHSKCYLEVAEKVLVVDNYEGYKSYFVEDVKLLKASHESKKISFSKDATITNENLSVYLDNGYFKESENLRAIWCKRICYIWDNEKSRFMKLVGLDKGRTCIDFHSFKGISSNEQRLRIITYGKNEIDIPVYSVLRLLVLEALTPFYIFQVFSLIVWFCEYYYYYTIAIVIMSVFGIATSIIQTRKNQKSLKESVHSSENVIVYRGNATYEEILSSNLVPGDLIEIPRTGCTMQCDAVLLNGNCVVNESMLTGESVPITKTPLPKTNVKYDVKGDSFHTLFSGTTVIQTRKQGNDKILAVVIRTGYLTTKGELVRSIIYPPPSDFKFDQDSYKFIGILTVISLLGCIYTIVSKSERGITAGDIIIKALDIITIVVPPALPAAMTVGKLYALSRLKEYKIYCMNSRVINVSGSIDCVCFDKTGTLTEDGLDMWGVVPVTQNSLQHPVKDMLEISKASPLLKGMATCHSITIIDKKLCGDPLDIKVFEFTNWLLEEDIGTDTSSGSCLAKAPGRMHRRVSSITDVYTENKNESDLQIEIIHQYQFSSSLQRMSVITKTANSDYFEVFCKGSPEIIVSLSNKESVPVDIDSRLKEYTVKGYRVIALATKKLTDYRDHEEIEKLDRSVLESNLTFVGLIVLENRIKPETQGVIKILKDANIKVIMITGDNIQTALSVAKECGIIENNQLIQEVTVKSLGIEQPQILFHATDFSKWKPGEISDKNLQEINLECGQYTPKYVYSMTGLTWAAVREHFPDQIPELIQNGTVFARMSGQQKQQLVQELQKLGYYVAMCGDGANDCGALKAAHVGVSLSEEQSSVASPFTSKNDNISCVPTIIKEGRASLTTSIGVFKFMVCYSLTQFSSVIILYGIDCNLTSLEFLFIDICLVINFTSFFGKTRAYDGPLDKIRPPTSLLSFTALTSIASQLFIVISFQVLSYKLVQTYSWFTPFHHNPDTPMYFTSYENYAVYCVSIFQYIIVAISFSKGKPYRKPIYTNFILSSSFVLMTAICIYITVNPAQWIKSTLELQLPPDNEFSFIILIMVAINFVCNLLFEDLIINYFLDKRLIPKIRKILASNKQRKSHKSFFVNGASKINIAYDNEKHCKDEKVTDNQDRNGGSTKL